MFIKYCAFSKSFKYIPNSIEPNSVYILSILSFCGISLSVNVFTPVRQRSPAGRVRQNQSISRNNTVLNEHIYLENYIYLYQMLSIHLWRCKGEILKMCGGQSLHHTCQTVYFLMRILGYWEKWFADCWKKYFCRLSINKCLFTICKVKSFPCLVVTRKEYSSTF